MPITSPATVRFFATRCTGTVPSEDYVEWAVSLLAEGFHSDSLAVLAGLTTSIHWQERDRYFNKALEELGWEAPSCDQVLRQYAQLVAEKIATRSIEPVQGCRMMYGLAVAMDYPEDMLAWVQLDDALDLNASINFSGPEAEADIIAEAKAMLAKSVRETSVGRCPCKSAT